MRLTRAYSHFRRAERRFKDGVLWPMKVGLKIALAGIYRLLIRVRGNVCFIGVTGSCGKTTTVELIAAILEKEGPIHKRSHANTREHLAHTILGVSRRDRFCVNEVSGHMPGVMAKSVRLLKPRIGVVTNIGQDHYSSFRDLELTAAEKGKLVEALPANGVAVLNTDDPYVYAMRERTKARVITYGLSAEATVRGENVSGAWPKRMSLDVSYAGRQIHIQTQLLGEHWACAVLAGLAAGIAVGVSLERAVGAVEAFEPVVERMSPHATAEGVTFISDDWKAPLWSVPACVDFMRKAEARRKIIVIGSISDTPKGFYHRYKSIVEEALDTAEKILFVGDHARSALKARPQGDDDRIMAFETLYQLHLFLGDYLEAGDLVLLKGTENADHLQRIVLARTNDAACWREKCGRRRLCTRCRLLHSRFVPGDQVQVD